MMYITRIEHFNAAHRLSRSDWDTQKNEEIFGKCANENGHGHNYELRVTVKGNIDPESGFICNAKTLSKIINEHLIEKIDHKNLNLDVDFMRGKIPSAEILTKEMREQLLPHITALGAELHCIELWETPRIYTQYFG